jgi:hypothetical protein
MLFPHQLLDALWREHELAVERGLRRAQERGAFQSPRQRRSITRIFNKEEL